MRTLVRTLVSYVLVIEVTMLLILAASRDGGAGLVMIVVDRYVGLVIIVVISALIGYMWRPLRC